MKLSEVVCSNWVCENRPLEAIEFSSIAFDSRKVSPGSLFVAIQGGEQDGHLFLKEAVQRGATAVMVQQGASWGGALPVPVVRVPNTRLALARMASHYYQSPSSELTLFGITGTNGKTTTAYLLAEMTRRLHKRFGLIGTVHYDLLGKQLRSERTTPDVLSLENLLAQIREEEGDGAILEVSSHALDQERVSHLHFDGVVFTNLSQDHLDYHRDMETYFQAKRRLFFEVLRQSKKEKKLSVVNVDDLYGRRLFEELGCEEKVSFGFSPNAQFRATEIEMGLHGSSFVVKTPTCSFPMRLSLLGKQNIENFLAAVALVSLLTEDIRFLGASLDVGVPGRLERFQSPNGASVFVDYAHTPDALEKMLLTLKPFVLGKLILVFGCGGERDKGKRPKMGNAAAQHADFVFLTHDNPRREDPLVILKEIQKGFPSGFSSFAVEEDRREAIERAIDQARPEDVVLIAGKGHESEQIFKDKVFLLSDREIVRNYASVAV